MLSASYNGIFKNVIKHFFCAKLCKTKLLPPIGVACPSALIDLARGVRQGDKAEVLYFIYLNIYYRSTTYRVALPCHKVVASFASWCFFSLLE